MLWGVEMCIGRICREDKNLLVPMKVESSQGSLQELDTDAPIAPFVRVTVVLIRQHMAVFLQRPINPGGKSLMTAPFFLEFLI